MGTDFLMSLSLISCTFYKLFKFFSAQDRRRIQAEVDGYDFYTNPSLTAVMFLAFRGTPLAPQSTQLPSGADATPAASTGLGLANVDSRSSSRHGDWLKGGLGPQAKGILPTSA